VVAIWAAVGLVQGARSSGVSTLPAAPALAALVGVGAMVALRIGAGYAFWRARAARGAP
jgi:hypothetical protein